MSSQGRGVSLSEFTDLPPVPQPVAGGAYDSGFVPPPASIRIPVSGQLADLKVYGGKRVGQGLTVDEAAEAASEAMKRALSVLKSLIAEGDRLVAAEVTVLVAADSDFTQHGAVGNGATKMLQDAGVLVARAAAGWISIPGGSPVEILCAFHVLPASAE